MQIKMRTLSAAVLSAVILLSAAGCGKKKVAAAPPPPPPAATPAPPPPAPPPPAAPAVSIDSFTVEPTSIERGQSATLRWSVANASGVSIDQGVGTVQANGSQQVSPNNSTTYTLTATGTLGATRTVTLNVNAPPPPPPPPPAPRVTISGADMLGQEAQDALFDYDMSDIRADAQKVLTADADLLKRIFAADPTFNVMIEGHADERGSAEYNLGLGDRRATTARDYLVMLGVPANRLSTISYGKEKPVCTDANEACYQRNRRAHLTPAR
jgi:peptidoglycan-associated lipoprotein